MRRRSHQFWNSSLAWLFAISDADLEKTRPDSCERVQNTKGSGLKCSFLEKFWQVLFCGGLREETRERRMDLPPSLRVAAHHHVCLAAR